MEKYGLDASPQGYWVQGYHDFFASYVNSNVVVFMEYDGKKFCAGIDVDDETILWDNYQSEEIEAVLQEYFTELYHLPQPYKTDIEFQLENARDIVQLHLQNGGREDLTMVISRLPFEIEDILCISEGAEEYLFTGRTGFTARG